MLCLSSHVSLQCFKLHLHVISAFPTIVKHMIQCSIMSQIEYEIVCFISAANYVRMLEHLSAADSNGMAYGCRRCQNSGGHSFLDDNFIEDFIRLKIDHIQSFQLEFCKYFFIVTYYSVYMHCENQ